MSIFGKIMSSIFGTSATAATPAAGAAAPGTPSAGGAAAKPMASVDVAANLDALAKSSKEKFEWRKSIVDLMKMLGMESSLQERKDLAMELGYPGELEGSAEMNIWLHKAVMRELAKNGGVVPAELLD